MELQARLQADVADADRERPRDRETHEVKSPLKIEPGASRSSSTPGVMSKGEIEEHASFAAEQGRRLDLDGSSPPTWRQVPMPPRGAS